MNAPLQLKVLTSSCTDNQARDFFEVTNTGSSSIPLSDISMKFWVFDTSGRKLRARVRHAGCIARAHGDNDCDGDDVLVEDDHDQGRDDDDRRHQHRVRRVTASATQFEPACGPDAQHQANWEIAIADGDHQELPAGAVWTHVGIEVELDDQARFSPGEQDWFSPCLGKQFAASSQFAVYDRGSLVLSPLPPTCLTAPECRTPSPTLTPVATPPTASELVPPEASPGNGGCQLNSAAICTFADPGELDGMHNVIQFSTTLECDPAITPGCPTQPLNYATVADFDRTTGGVNVGWTISQGSSTVLQTQTQSLGGVTTVTANYGPAFTGVRKTSFTSNGTVITGAVDGRAIVPVPANKPPATIPSGVKFADGSPPPPVQVDPQLATNIERLLRQVLVDETAACVDPSDACNSCNNVASDSALGDWCFSPRS